MSSGNIESRLNSSIQSVIHKHIESPCMRASDVPETWWHHVERESYDLDDVKSQFDGLTSEIAKGELIRNPLIEKTVIAAWEPLQP
jgi:hypothetical protein